MTEDYQTRFGEVTGFIDGAENIKLYSTAGQTYSSLIKNLLGESLDENQDLSKYGITNLDAFSLKLKNFEINNNSDFIKILQNVFGKENIIYENNVLKKESIEYINNLINEAIYFYENELLFKLNQNFFKNRNGCEKSREIKFRNIDEIYSFVYEVDKKSSTNMAKQINCSLLKIIYIIGGVYQEEELLTLENDMENLLEESILPWFNIWNNKSENSIDINQNNLDNYDFTTLFQKNCPNHVGNYDEVNFSLSARSKSKNSLILKMLYNSQYDELNAINDSFGFRAVVHTYEEAIQLLHYIYDVIFQQKGEVKNKGVINDNSIQSANAKYTIPESFNTIMEKKKNKDINTSTNGNYEDVKVIGEIAGKSVEFQIVLEGNKNETGYSHHGILDLSKRLQSVIRLQGYITENHVYNHIRNAIFLDDDLRNRGNGDFQKAVDNIYDYIINDQGVLYEMYIPKASPKKRFSYYTTNENFKKYIESGFISEGAQIKHPKFTNGDWKKLNEIQDN